MVAVQGKAPTDCQFCVVSLSAFIRLSVAFTFEFI